MPPITVEIADREETRRLACVRLLLPHEGIEVVGEARNGPEVVTATAKLKPDILLLSFNLLRGREIALLLTLREMSPRTKVILLARRAPKPRLLQALSYGAHGYIDEKAVAAFLPKAVRLVESGQAWVPRKVVARIAERLNFLMSHKDGNEADIGLKS